jgi:hypothetical protein
MSASSLAREYLPKLALCPNGSDQPNLFQKYIDWERGYKWTAQQHWQEILGQEKHWALIRRGEAMEVAACAVRIESRTNFTFFI